VADLGNTRLASEDPGNSGSLLKVQVLPMADGVGTFMGGVSVGGALLAEQLRAQGAFRDVKRIPAHRSHQQCWRPIHPVLELQPRW